jgi:hypothetical protein
MDDEVLELRARLTFIEAILEGRLVVANVTDDVLLSGLMDLSLPPLSCMEHPDTLKAFEYLLRIRIDRIKASAVDDLRKMVKEALEARDLLASKSAEALWLADLDTFELVYKTFCDAKQSIYEEAQKVKEVKHEKKKRVVKK